jgi:CheY-like chemotaxis protein
MKLPPLRKSEKTALAHIPIVAITANAMKGDAQKALDAGCSMYMSKPINIQELLEKVAKFTYKDAWEIRYEP